MLRVRHLSREGLGPISFELAAGECLAVTGPSGAGKTLLLRAIADLDPNSGTVELGTTSREGVPAHRWRRLVTYLPAESGWWHDVVTEHMADREASIPLIEAVGLPRASLDWEVARLSTGEKQRLALVRAVVLEPRVLLLDEPTSGLDRDATAAVEGVLKRLLDAGTAIVLVTHDHEQARRMAVRRLQIDAGRQSEPHPADEECPP